jgi:hypothetical protein
MKMKVIPIDSPDDFFYPLDKKTYKNPRILYHGTSSTFSSAIEKRGLRIDYQPCAIEDIMQLCDMYESLGRNEESGTCYVLQDKATKISGGIIGVKTISFADDYWIARNYACNPGGETLQDILRATEELSKYILQMGSRPNFDQESKFMVLQAQRAKYVHGRYRGCSDEGCNTTHFGGLISSLNFIKKKYERIISKHYPVVFAAKVEPEWFVSWLKDLEDGIDGQKLRLDLHCKIPIPPTNLRARIDFPNGANRFSPSGGDPLPVPWNRDEFLEWAKINGLGNHRAFTQHKLMR